MNLFTDIFDETIEDIDEIYVEQQITSLQNWYNQYDPDYTPNFLDRIEYYSHRIEHFAGRVDNWILRTIRTTTFQACVVATVAWGGAFGLVFGFVVLCLKYGWLQ